MCYTYTHAQIKTTKTNLQKIKTLGFADMVEGHIATLQRTQVHPQRSLGGS